MGSFWSSLLSHKDHNKLARDTGREMAKIFLEVYLDTQQTDAFPSMTRDEQYISVVQAYYDIRNTTGFQHPTHGLELLESDLWDDIAHSQVSLARQYAETELNQTFQFVHVVGIIALGHYEMHNPDDPCLSQRPSILTVHRARHILKGVYEIIPPDL